ncbi:MAG: thioredoxin-dependent thiol peroxidase [Crocinitomicaceae bacterium]|nr:thioredoxin-dependent thiol peroxidase [Crocinitomicaceae bacterium]
MKLKVGDKAPELSGKDQDGKAVSLADYKGKKLILYFYPKDLTPGCTAESCNFRDHYQDLAAKGFDVLGVSADDENKHQKFIEKHELPFRLLADVDKKVINAYGVWGPKKFMGREYDGINRTTFIINEEGKIQLIIEKVKTKESTEQILAELEN